MKKFDKRDIGEFRYCGVFGGSVPFFSHEIKKSYPVKPFFRNHFLKDNQVKPRYFNMMQRLLLCLTLLTFSLGLDAQIPPACFPPNSPPADDCGDACIYCNFNGINSQTTGYSPGGVPQFCGSIENDQWLGFIAGCTTATFSVTPSNCTDGNGCQIALYEECGGPFLQCNVGCSGCGTTTQSITVTNMAIGTNYYLLIDGLGRRQLRFPNFG